MLDNTKLDSLIVYAGSLFDRPRLLWCVVKTREARGLLEDSIIPVGNIVYVSKTEAAAIYSKNKRNNKQCYEVKLFNFIEAGV